MKITGTVNELIDLLIDMSDSDGFVKAVVSIAGNDENRQLIIDYINRKKDKGVQPDTSQLLKIAMYLASQEER